MAQQWYPQGTRPWVLINWQSFTDQGIDAGWQGAFTDAVINAYTRWMNVAGVDLRFKFWGYTTKTAADPGELVIHMEPSFGGGPIARLASTLGSYNRLRIAFHRTSAADGTVFNFVPYNAQPGEFDMQTILMHEFGHCHGLDHSSSTSETMFGSYIYFQRFGPFEGDVAAVKALYSDFNQNRLRQLRSGDGGASWSSVANELTSYNHVHARTNMSPGVAGIGSSGLYAVGWNHANRIPTWLRTDGEKFLMRRWLYYGGERSVHGPSCASDSTNGTLLWAWVNNDDVGSLRVRRSLNRGMDWSPVGVPANARAYGTPGLAWTNVGGVSTWILTWSHFDRADQVNTGRIRASISTDNGTTWSAAVFLGVASLKATSGIAIAASPNNEVMVGCSWVGVQTAGINEILTFRCNVNAGQLQLQNTIALQPSERTRIQPALAFDSARGSFILAWREQNANTTLATMIATPGGATWGGKVELLGWGTHVAPAMAAIPEYGETVLWYAFEGS